MNSNFTPNQTQGVPVTGEPWTPDMPKECIQLPEPPKPVKEAATSWFVEEAAEITWEQWNNLRPLGCLPEVWSNPDVAISVRRRVVRAFDQEKRAKIFPISWARLKEIVDSEWARWHEASKFEEQLRSMDGLRGMNWDDAQELIKECVASNGATWDRFKANLTVLNICHRLANAAHRRGAREMQEIMLPKVKGDTDKPKGALTVTVDKARSVDHPTSAMLLADFSKVRFVSLEMTEQQVKKKKLDPGLAKGLAPSGISLPEAVLSGAIPITAADVGAGKTESKRDDPYSARDQNLGLTPLPDDGPHDWDEFFDKHVDPDRP